MSFIESLADRISELRRKHGFKPSYNGWHSSDLSYTPRIQGDSIILSWENQDRETDEFSINYDYLFMEWEDIKKSELKLFEIFHKLERTKKIRETENEIQLMKKQISYIEEKVENKSKEIESLKSST